MKFDKIKLKAEESGINISKFIGVYVTVCLENNKENEFYIIRSTYNHDLEYAGSSYTPLGDKFRIEAAYTEKGWESEANPKLGIISDKSPMGESLLSHKKNDIIIVKNRRYLIKETL